MEARGNGHIFNICSVASLLALPGGGSYTVTKFAMLGWSKALREELKKAGVKVTSILPGATWSDSWKGVDLPENRLMQATDIANTLWSAYQLSPSAVVEDIVLRPQLGDL
jgi:short-subunit dehydrogenase